MTTLRDFERAQFFDKIEWAIKNRNELNIITYNDFIEVHLHTNINIENAVAVVYPDGIYEDCPAFYTPILNYLELKDFLEITTKYDDLMI